MDRMAIGRYSVLILFVCSLVFLQTPFFPFPARAEVQADKQIIVNVVTHCQNKVRQVLPGSRFQAVTDGQVVRYPGLPQERFQFELCMEGKGLPMRSLKDAK